MTALVAGRTLVIATGHHLSLALIEPGLALAEHEAAIERGHAEALMPAVVGLLAPFGGRDAGCEHVIVEVGPGSFTGLRVGIAAAQALALAWGCTIDGVRSTQLVAADARSQGIGGPLVVALGAPRGQIWTECFAAGGLDGDSDVAAGTADEARALLAARPGATMVGTGASLAGGTGPALAPRAAAVLGLADSMLVRAEPLYVRAGDTTVST